ncbi:MAG: hypothetical protein RLZZ21_1386 [Planctomycetota bacterium]
MRVLAVLIGFFCTASFGQEVVYLGSPCANGRCRVVTDTSTAQGVAEACARSGQLRHMGGNVGMMEGIGMGSTPAAAIRNCCYFAGFASWTRAWPVVAMECSSPAFVGGDRAYQKKLR